MIRGGASNPSDTHELSAENEKIAVPGEVDRVTNENSGKVKRVVVTGGAGQIAYALLPLILHGKVFGPDCKVSLRLLDIRACSKALEGVAMEVRDCNCDVLLDVMATTDTDSAFDGADVAILLGGVPRGPGMERRDLIARNVPIMAEHGRALERAASKDVRVVVVANPANTNCLVASLSAPSIPRGQFTSLSRLDHDRLSSMLSECLAGLVCCQVAPSPPPARIPVRGVCLWGNHSPTMFPDISRAEAWLGGRWVPARGLLCSGIIGEGAVAKLGALSAPPTITPGDEDRERRLVEAVRGRGAQVIEARQKSSAMSTANAIANHLRDWLSPPPSAPANHKAAAEGKGNTNEAGTSIAGGAASPGPARGPAVSMGVSSDGNPYGVPDGLVFSFPVGCGGGGFSFEDGLEVGPELRAMLDASVKELIEERDEALAVLGADGGGQ